MSNLYEISTHVRDLNILAGRKLTEEQQEQFELIKTTLMGQLSEKATDIIHVINKNERDIDYLKEEIKRLKSLQISLEDKNQGLKDFLVVGLEFSGLNTIETPEMRIELGKLPDLLTITDVDDVKEEFMKEPPKQENKPDKKALLDEYKKTGVIPAGCKIETDRKKINVK